MPAYTGSIRTDLKLVCTIVTPILFLYYRLSLQRTWAVNSQLQATSAQHFPHLPAPTLPPALTLPIPLPRWGLVKALWAQLLRGLGMLQPRTVLLSGQDPQEHARSACSTTHSQYHNTSHLQQPRCPCTKATTSEQHQPPRNQSVHLEDQT